MGATRDGVAVDDRSATEHEQQAGADTDPRWGSARQRMREQAECSQDREKPGRDKQETEEDRPSRRQLWRTALDVPQVALARTA
jgi:hypothetical protein